MKLTRITRSVLWCLIGGLAACATPPADTAPEAVIPAHYPGLAPNAAERTDTDWRSLFTDPHLLALIDSALTHNRDLKLAVARVAEVRALYDIQQAGSRPGIDVIASGSRARTPADLSVTGADTEVTATGALGAVVNFVAGNVQRAPVWMQRAGLEWVWRIREEPALWKRYASDGISFLLILMKTINTNWPKKK